MTLMILTILLFFLFYSRFFLTKVPRWHSATGPYADSTTLSIGIACVCFLCMVHSGVRYLQRSINFVSTCTTGNMKQCSHIPVPRWHSWHTSFRKTLIVRKKYLLVTKFSFFHRTTGIPCLNCSPDVKCLCIVKTTGPFEE